MPNITHNICDPVMVSRNKLGNRINSLSLREEVVYVLNSVCECRLLHRAVLLTIINDSHHLRVREDFVILLSLFVKYIVFHFSIVSFIYRIFCFFIGVAVRKNFTDDSFESSPLLLCHRVEDILNCFSRHNFVFVLILFCFICFGVRNFFLFTSACLVHSLSYKSKCNLLLLIIHRLNDVFYSLFVIRFSRVFFSIFCFLFCMFKTKSTIYFIYKYSSSITIPIIGM